MNDFTTLNELEEALKKKKEREESLRKIINDYHNCKSIVDCHDCSANKNV